MCVCVCVYIYIYIYIYIYMCVCVCVYTVFKFHMYTGDPFMRVYLRPQTMQLLSAPAHGVSCQIASMYVLVYVGDLSLMGF